MKRCGICKARIAKQNKFCGHCGARQHYEFPKRSPINLIAEWFSGLLRDDLDERFDEACKFVQFGGFDGAVEEVERIAQLKPGNTRFRSILSIFCFGAADERLGLLSMGGPLRDLSRWFSEEGAYKAEEILSCISPDDLGAKPSRTTNSLSHFALDEALNRALEMYDKSIELSPENPESYLARARAFHELADHVLMAFGIFPDYESPYARESQAETFKAGSICLGIDKRPKPKPEELATKILWLYSHAEADYAKASEVDPTNAETYLSLSHVRRQQGKVILADNNRDKALALLNRAISVDGSDSGSYFSRARIFEEVGELTLAIADFEKVLILSDSEFQLSSAKSRIEKLRAKTNQ